MAQRTKGLLDVATAATAEGGAVGPAAAGAGVAGMAGDGASGTAFAGSATTSLGLLGTTLSSAPLATEPAGLLLCAILPPPGCVPGFHIRSSFKGTLELRSELIPHGEILLSRCVTCCCAGTPLHGVKKVFAG